MSSNLTVTDRLNNVRRQVEAAAERAKRDPAGIRLVAVSKGQPVEAVKAALDAGQCDFGENYLEEALPKIRSLDPSAVWHMIGHVQSRKAKGVAEAFPIVQSVDSVALARKLSATAVERGKVLTVFFECNVSGEESKFGWRAADPSAWKAIFDEWRQILALPGLTAAGLMTMAPYSDDPERSRPVFRTLRKMRDSARRDITAENLNELSMGMSDDFPQAIEEGATVLRVGRAIFGPRQPASGK